MNKQEKSWSEDFGDGYHKRNPPTNREALWRAALAKVSGINSVLEFGCGQGDNLVAIRALYPNARQTGVDINPAAASTSRQYAPGSLVYSGSVLDTPPTTADLVITRGLLIHIPPSELTTAYRNLYRAAKKYICIAEYYSPQPREILYHKQPEMLWARDFAGEMLDAYPDLELLDCGFAYYRNGGHDVTWFLMEKSNV